MADAGTTCEVDAVVSALAQRTRAVVGGGPDARRARSVAIGAVVVAGAVVAHLVNPARDHWLPKCPFHELTGLWCPACGSTRAACSLAHGDLLGAVRHNVLFLPALALMLWLWVAYAARAFSPAAARGAWSRGPLAVLRRPWWLVGIVLCFWVLRNVPGAPEHLLSR